MPKSSPKKKTDSSANIGFEVELWLSADKLRNNMDAAEYKHVVLGLIFLKYISDSFDEHHIKLVAGKGDIRQMLTEDFWPVSAMPCIPSLTHSQTEQLAA